LFINERYGLKIVRSFFIFKKLLVFIKQTVLKCIHMQPKIITSLDNSKVKQLKKLQLKKYRQDMKMFVVENLVIIKDALRAGYIFEDLFLTEEFVDNHKKDLIELLKKAGVNSYYEMSDKVNRSFSKLDSPAGIAAIYKTQTKELSKNKSVVYLNGINDPGNLGTIFRSALAFGFKNIVVDKNCVDIYNAKVISAAKDSFFKLNIIKDEQEDWLANTQLPIYATNSHQGVDLEKIKIKKNNFCLVFGNETHGVDKSILDKSEQNIKINITKEIESLNVATAASIVLYKFRQ